MKDIKKEYKFVSERVRIYGEILRLEKHIKKYCENGTTASFLLKTRIVLCKAKLFIKSTIEQKIVFVKNTIWKIKNG